MIIPDVIKTRIMSPPTNVRQRRGVSVSSRAGLLQNQEGVEEEDVMDTGTLDTISQQYESLNYFTNYNSLLLDEIRKMGFKFVKGQKFIQIVL